MSLCFSFSVTDHVFVLSFINSSCASCFTLVSSFQFIFWPLPFLLLCFPNSLRIFPDCFQLCLVCHLPLVYLTLCFFTVQCQLICVLVSSVFACFPCLYVSLAVDFGLRFSPAFPAWSYCFSFVCRLLELLPLTCWSVFVLDLHLGFFGHCLPPTVKLYLLCSHNKTRKLNLLSLVFLLLGPNPCFMTCIH